ncbi:hypothetical protein HGA34_02465 [Candidatus Falkowbacteria bacterium]|nr:hypothetical protein [Candidatus Falkowbacteria bacterium]
MEYRYFVRKIHQPTPEIVALELADRLGRPVFAFRPGQYVMIAYTNAKGLLERKHAFSLASSPTETDHIKLGIKVGGKFTQGLLGLKPGDQVIVNGPFGNFVFDEAKHKNAVFLAGGIGITPFYSALKYATDRKLDNRMTLLYSNRTLERTLYYREIKALETKNKNLRALFSVTDKNILPVAGRVVNKRLDGQVINEFVGGHEGKTFFICGPAPFMKAMKGDLLGLGVKPSQIEMEGFSMMTGSGALAGTKNVAYAMGFSGALMLGSFYLIANPGTTPSLDSLEKLGLSNYLLNSDSSPEAQAAEVPVVMAESGLPVSDVLAAADAAGTSTGSGILALAEVAQEANAANTTAAAVQLPAVKKAATATTAPTPAPVTHASPVKEAAAVSKSATPAATASKTASAPTPVTSASAPAHTTPTVTAPTPATPTTATAPSTAPTPVTSASAPASTPAAPSTPSTPTTASQPTAPAPAPTTSASAPAASGSSSNTTPTTVNTSTPTPTTPVSSRSRSNDDDDD